MKLQIYFPQRLLNMSIDEMDFSTRTSNCLKRAKIFTMDELVENFSDLYKVKNMGTKSLEEIKGKLIELKLNDMGVDCVCC